MIRYLERFFCRLTQGSILLHSAISPGTRINRDPIHIDSPMEVGTGRSSRRTDGLPRLNHVSFVDRDAVEVNKDAADPLAMVNADSVAMELKTIGDPPH